MKSRIPSAKLEIDYAVNTQLLYILQAPRPKVLTEFQCEVAGCVTFLLLILQHTCDIRKASNVGYAILAA